MTDTLSHWQEIVLLTQQMQQHFVDKNWQEVMLLQQQRETRIHDFFAQGVSAEQRNDIQQLLVLNQGMSAQLVESRSALSGQLEKMLRGQSGVDHYQQVLHHK